MSLQYKFFSIPIPWIVSSRDDFLFSGKEDELFMKGVYSSGTGPEEKANLTQPGAKRARDDTIYGQDVEDGINAFLRNVRLVHVHREIVCQDNRHYWAVSVEYLTGTAGEPAHRTLRA
jgi:hypothetical protein